MYQNELDIWPPPPSFPKGESKEGEAERPTTANTRLFPTHRRKQRIHTKNRTHMTKILLSTLLILVFTAPSLRAEQPSQLTVKIENISSDKGQLLIGIYNQAQGAFETGNEYTGDIVQAHKGSMTFNYKLPQGQYAVAVIHDSNGNRQLDKNFLGIPTEDYGFSNGISRPDYDKARFLLSGDTTLIIRL